MFNALPQLAAGDCDASVLQSLVNLSDSIHFSLKYDCILSQGKNTFHFHSEDRLLLQGSFLFSNHRSKGLQYIPARILPSTFKNEKVCPSFSTFIDKKVGESNLADSFCIAFKSLCRLTVLNCMSSWKIIKGV